MSPVASIVIRCYNEEKHIGKLLYGVAEQQLDGDFEIVVVDSGSTDRTLEIARQFPIELVTIRPEEFSFGRALNLGCSRARGDFLVFASAHVYPLYNDWLAKLLASFDDEQVATVYGKQRGGPQTRYSERQIFARWFPDQSIDVQKTPFCNNANCAVRREVWEQAPYDEELTGLEDVAWAKEVMQMGYCVSYAADAVIAHIHEESPHEIFNRYMREAIALKDIYPEQHMSLVDFTRLFLQNTVTDYAHALIDGELSEHLVDIPLFRFMQFLGAYRGFHQSGPVPERLKRTFYYPRKLPFNGSEDLSESDNRKEIDYRSVYHEATRVD
jgi:glycosyltransferase involved in cell wall biosynthesis